jgi:hypothetical protein
MTERERWIVYPLLFLALGAALRDKLFDRTTTKSIVCEELTIVDQEPLGQQPVFLARIGRVESAPGGPTYGYFAINGQVDVNGVVNAQQYAYKGVPFVPALQAAFPGVAPADLLRMLHQSAQSWQQSGKPAEPAQTSESSQPPSASAATPNTSNEQSNAPVSRQE